MSDVDLPTEDAYNRHPWVFAGKSRVLGQRNVRLEKILRFAVMSVFGIIVKIGRLWQLVSMFGCVQPTPALSKDSIFPSSAFPRRASCCKSMVYWKILSWLFLNASMATVAADQLVPAPGDLLLKKAAQQLRQHPSISAKIRQQINLYGKHLPGSGVYLQQRMQNYNLIRMELKIQRSDQITSIQQVSDGRFLWLYRNVEGKSELSRIDLKRISEASHGRWPLQSCGLVLPEGLPAVVEQIADNFHFDQPRLAMLRGEKIWALIGNWRVEKFAEWSKHQGGTAEADGTIHVDKHSPHLPEKVEIALGRDDLFPYRIQYLRRNSTSSTSDATFTPIVTMLIFDVRIGKSLDPMLFAYHPQDLEVQDRTSETIERLVNLQQNAAER